MNGMAQSMDGSGGGGNGRWWALRWEMSTTVARLGWVTATAVAAQWMASRRRDHDARHRDHGGRRRCNGQRWRNGRQDGRASAAEQADGVSPSSRCSSER